jgi:agmatine/peptidylarginine deiminase
MQNIRYLPAEWTEQEFVAVIFPHQATDWAEMLDEACGCFLKIVGSIAVRQCVLVICADIVVARNYLQNVDNNIIFAEISTNDTWARDCLGITIFENGEPVMLDFSFNGWGLKFAADLDNQITSKLFNYGLKNRRKLQIKNCELQTDCRLSINYQLADCREFILEGGSIESDGTGTILTTEKCLLSENRNYLSKKKIEQKLKKYLGANRVLWLKHGEIAGDDTDSHIDTLARFCNKNTIVYVQCLNRNNANYQELTAMERELQAFRTADGLPYTLIPLPMADEVFFNGKHLPATYANFLIINGAVLLPTYNSPKDDIAAEILQKVFPTREIVKVNCLPLIKQHGSLHCVTMQFPKKMTVI